MPVFFMVAILASSATLAFVDKDWKLLLWILIASGWYGLYEWEKSS